MAKIDVESLNQDELDALNKAIKARMERIGKLKADLQAVTDLVASKGWKSLDYFMSEVGYVKAVPRVRKAKSHDTDGAPARRLTDGERAEMERLLRDGSTTVRAIANKFSVSQTTVMLLKNKLGLVRKRKGSR
jgi:hypothetical protein